MSQNDLSLPPTLFNDKEYSIALENYKLTRNAWHLISQVIKGQSK